MMVKKIKIIEFEEFETRCKTLAKIIKSNKSIKNIYGVARGGCIPAIRISYLTGKPITGFPHFKETAVIEDFLNTGMTRHSFGNFTYFFPLVDKQEEKILDWIKFWYEEKLDEK